MIIACLFLIFFCSNNSENRLVNKVCMIGCMTCSWSPTTGGTTAQSGQRNDGATAPNTQQLHHRLGHISTEHFMQTLRNPQHSKKHLIIYTK